MAVLVIIITTQLYMLATAKPTQTLCLGGIVMVPHKGGDMWVQRGLWPTYCMPVDRD